MKKIVRILVRKAQRRTFNILLDDSSDIIATESAIRHIVEEGDEYISRFFFEEAPSTVMFIGMETLDRFPYRDDIAHGVHRVIYVNNQAMLQEISVDELTALDIEEQKKEGA
jgi:hypothetical protein